MRSRTELECTVADLRLAAERAGGKREELEEELAHVEELIMTKEAELSQVVPQWEAHRTSENDEKHRLDEARARLDSLYAKRGRLNKYRTRAERDQFLTREIASIDAYRMSQDAALNALRTELESAKVQLQEVEERIVEGRSRVEDERGRAKDLAEQAAQLKEEHADLTEKRKSLWREDTKLNSLVAHAADELRSAERTLASMMDKVSRLHLVCTFQILIVETQDTGSGLRAIDKIAERFNLDGVYGPLYRLFEVTDEKFNIAVELTAGNR